MKLKRYLLYTNKKATLDLPLRANIIEVAAFSGGPCLYILIDEEQKERELRVFHTIEYGDEIMSDWMYRGMFQSVGIPHFVFEEWRLLDEEAISYMGKLLRDESIVVAGIAAEEVACDSQ